MSFIPFCGAQTLKHFAFYESGHIATKRDKEFKKQVLEIVKMRKTNFYKKKSHSKCKSLKPSNFLKIEIQGPIY